MAAIFRISQNGSVGDWGIARKDIATGSPAALLEGQDLATTYLWEVISAPQGSGHVLTDETLRIASLTLDTTGGYLIRYTVDDGLPTKDIGVLYLGIPLEYSQLCIPAFNETYFDNSVIGDPAGYERKLTAFFKWMDDLGNATLHDAHVRVSDTDTTTDFLGNKLVPGYGIGLTVLDSGGDESIRVDVLTSLTGPYKETCRIAVPYATGFIPSGNLEGIVYTADADGNLNDENLDGVSDLQVGDHILIISISTYGITGIWEILDLGDALNPFVLQRAYSFADVADAGWGSLVKVADGDRYAGTTWRSVTRNPTDMDYISWVPENTLAYSTNSFGDESVVLRNTSNAPNGVATAGGYCFVYGWENTVTGQSSYHNTLFGNTINVGNIEGSCYHNLVVGRAMNLDNALHNLVVGSSQGVASSQNNLVLGYSQYVTSGTQYSVLVGANQNVSGLTYSLVLGNGNTIAANLVGLLVTGEYQNVGAGSSYASVWGQYNTVAGGNTYMTMGGSQNIASSGGNEFSVVFGDQNTLGSPTGGCSASFMAGRQNTIGAGSVTCGVWGRSNSIQAGSSSSAAFGSYNTIRGGSINTLVAGYYNTVDQGAGYSAVFGTTNAVNDSSSGSLVGGKYNTVTGSASGTLVAGESNTVRGANNAVFGTYNSITAADSVCNIFGGAYNEIQASVCSYNTLFGFSNIIPSSGGGAGYNLVTGVSNVVDQGSMYCALVGAAKSLVNSGSMGSLVTGVLAHSGGRRAVHVNSGGSPTVTYALATAADAGWAQNLDMIPHTGQTNDDTPTVIYMDGADATETFTITPRHLYTLKTTVSAFCGNTNGVKTWEINAQVYYTDAIYLVTDPEYIILSETSAGLEALWDVTLSAGLGALTVTVTGAVGETINWQCYSSGPDVRIDAILS